MDFTLDATQAEIAALTADVLAREPEHAWPALAKAGLLTLALPAELDGDGLGPAEIAVVLTEVGRAAAPVPALASLALGVLPLNRHGSPEQRARWLPEIASGESVVTAAVHEPSAPFVAEPGTEAVAVDGGWVLTGTKTRVPSLPEARCVLVPARLPWGTGVFLVDPRARGAEVHGTTLRLDGVRVGEADLVRDAAPADLHRCALAGAVALGDGAVAGALALTTEHIRQREQFGRPLATFQAVAQQIADVYIASRTLHLAALSAVWRLAEGLDADEDLAVAAYWLAEEAPKALAVCHHLHGGLGVDITYPLHRHYGLVKELAAFTGGASARLDRLGDLVEG
ncbi:acyl-CoA dehydrogenase family protein [Amycolatopsis thermophila]|uniref:Alkylation response protein AidB-like acyl-CoA dehydrogenase n=1 Tax=Amycolatopsis thermophila TaxID=206084 RepID=A0ABU0EXU2_9PSEU|nr:acyl-CoA dehydrogenase family protein [Amycolatopsis thermophila]MDQ0380144.1 alkylation response protein AidB-like acyl-CoA dehydrogenase [Amycolatopsis thermophila]